MTLVYESEFDYNYYYYIIIIYTIIYLKQSNVSRFSVVQNSYNTVGKLISFEWFHLT